MTEQRRDLTRVLDEDGQLRLCVGRLGQALAGLLGREPGPELAANLRALADLADGVGELCRWRAQQVDHVDRAVGEAPCL
jgi:hypothetical protein